LILPLLARVWLIGLPALRRLTYGGAGTLAVRPREVHFECIAMCVSSAHSQIFGTGRVYADVAAVFRSESRPSFPP
jgi:hypothetical protein